MGICCVIGGAGFIGRHLVRELLRTGRTVRVAGRRDRALTKLPVEVEYCQGDIRNQDFVSQVLQDVDEVVDLAYSTVPKTSYENPLLDITDNLPSSVGLFDVASRLPIKKLVFVSSGGTVYGESQILPITETHPTNPISPYGITKLALEKYAQFYHKLQGLPVVCVRPANPYGEGQRAFEGQGFVSTAVASILTGREITIFGESGTVRDYIYVEDVAIGLVAALDSGVAGECYNIGTGIGRSNLEIIEQLAVLARRQGIATVVTNALARSFDVATNVLDSKKLTAVSGWTAAISLEDGLTRTWDWFAAESKKEMR